MKITDTMVLALLKKGLVCELEDLKGTMSVPISVIHSEADASKTLTIEYEVKMMSFKMEKD